MNSVLPAAVPEVPVRNIDEAVAYYANGLGFARDWGDESGGIAGISNGDCRLFLTNSAFRGMHGNCAPVLVWINLNSRDEVDALHRTWSGNGAAIVSTPETKPWNLHEFTAADLDGNLLRVFHDLAWQSGSSSGRQA